MGKLKQQTEEKLKASTVKKLQPFHAENRTIDYTAAKTNMARGTVGKYFRHLDNKLIEELDNDFIRTQKLAKARGLAVLDKLIADLKEVLNSLKVLNNAHMEREKKQWQKDKSHEIEINKYLTDRIAKYTKDIFNMEQVKVMIQMKPTADITLQLQIDELLAKVKPEDLQHLIEEQKGKDEK